MDHQGKSNAPPGTPPQPRQNHATPPPPAQPPRGVVFDPAALPPSTTNGVIDFKKKGLPWLLVGAAVLFLTYNIGSYVSLKSRQPMPMGPFASTPGAASVKVQVVGQVRSPGLYTLSSGSRIQDAIDIAGGPLPGADLDSLDLATWVTDGSRIDVPARAAQNAPVQNAPVQNLPVQNAPTQLAPTAASIPATIATPAMVAPPPLVSPIPSPVPGANPSPPDAATAESDTSTKTPIETLKANPVDLNKASAAELTTLPGIGPKMAQRIVDYRTSNGPFQNVDGLDSVKGFGSKRMDKLRELVTVR